MKWIAVFLGGGLGSLARLAISTLFSAVSPLFPWATLSANALAAIVIAWLYAAGMKSGNELVWQFAAIGFCGGLSTFSTFSMETIQLMRTGNQSIAWLYIALSVSLSLLLFYFISNWFPRT